MKELYCREITEILNEYDIEYKNVRNMGEVDLSSYQIYINPKFNQDVETLAHEFGHIWYENILEMYDTPEDIIEKESQEMIKQKHIYKCLEKYLDIKTMDQKLEYK